MPLNVPHVMEITVFDLAQEDMFHILVAKPLIKHLSLTLKLSR